MFVAADIKVYIAFIQRIVGVLWAHAGFGDTLHARNLEGYCVQLFDRVLQGHVAVDARQLHAAEGVARHFNAVRNAVRPHEVSGVVGDNQVLGVYRLDDGALTDRAMVAFLEASATGECLKEHPVRVRHVLRGHVRQIRVAGVLKQAGQLIVAVLNLDRPLSR